MFKFLGKYNFPKVNQGIIEIKSCSINKVN